MDVSDGFDDLTPDRLLNAVEEATGRPLTGLAHPLTSYINRVYELQAVDGTRLIAKFYRPGRWSWDALLDEHDFLLDCAEDEIPVIAPMELADGSTLADAGGICFAVFPKGLGREMDIKSDGDWQRLGRIIGRVHLAGSRQVAEHRIVMHPEASLADDIRQLLDGGFIARNCRSDFQRIADQIRDVAISRFDGVETIRIHGDCHRGNLLDRLDQGLMIIDFDDMAMGPPVQDLWMLLPEHANQARHEINQILTGYEEFFEFDDHTLRLIEPLRAMRILYFLAWCSRQIDDYVFRTNFPDWGSEDFWRKEIYDLEQQLKIIHDH